MSYLIRNTETAYMQDNSNQMIEAGSKVKANLVIILMMILVVVFHQAEYLKGINCRLIIKIDLAFLNILIKIIKLKKI